MHTVKFVLLITQTSAASFCDLFPITGCRRLQRCQKGFSFSDTSDCVDVDECNPNFNWDGTQGGSGVPCPYKCENTSGGYNCSCPTDWSVDEHGKCIPPIHGPCNVPDTTISWPPVGSLQPPNWLKVLVGQTTPLTGESIHLLTNDSMLGETAMREQSSCQQLCRDVSWCQLWNFDPLSFPSCSLFPLVNWSEVVSEWNSSDNPLAVISPQLAGAIAAVSGFAMSCVGDDPTTTPALTSPQAANTRIARVALTQCSNCSAPTATLAVEWQLPKDPHGFAYDITLQSKFWTTADFDAFGLGPTWRTTDDDACILKDDKRNCELIIRSVPLGLPISVIVTTAGANVPGNPSDIVKTPALPPPRLNLIVSPTTFTSTLNALVSLNDDLNSTSDSSRTARWQLIKSQVPLSVVAQIFQPSPYIQWSISHNPGSPWTRLKNLTAIEFGCDQGGKSSSNSSSLMAEFDEPSCVKHARLDWIDAPQYLAISTRSPTGDWSRLPQTAGTRWCDSNRTDVVPLVDWPTNPGLEQYPATIQSELRITALKIFISLPCRNACPKFRLGRMSIEFCDQIIAQWDISPSLDSISGQPQSAWGIKLRPHRGRRLAASEPIEFIVLPVPSMTVRSFNNANQTFSGNISHLFLTPSTQPPATTVTAKNGPMSAIPINPKKIWQWVLLGLTIPMVGVGALVVVAIRRCACPKTTSAVAKPSPPPPTSSSWFRVGWRSTMLSPITEAGEEDEASRRSRLSGVPRWFGRREE